jgi:hypothetical protein
MQVSPERHRAGSLPARSLAGDRSLTVSARADNPASQSYGIIFNRVEGDVPEAYQAFVVSPQGYYGIIAGDGSAIVPMTMSDAIHQGTAVNQMVVDRVGQQITCSINGIQVVALSGEAYAAGDRYGLISVCQDDMQSDARFDDFCVEPLGNVVGVSTSTSGDLPTVTR